MYPTIDQAFKQALTDQQNGRAQDAERLYRGILRSEPLHPAANHNLGVLAISLNRVDAALPLFETALRANPKIEQFWISYINALIKKNRHLDAKKAIKKARKKGFEVKKLEALLLQSKVKANTKKPPQEQISSLMEHFQNERFAYAEEIANKLIYEFPNHHLAWKVLGALFEQTSRNYEALNANQTAVSLAPQDSEAHCNLGNIYRKLGKLDEAEASYRQAIVLKADLIPAHNNLGATFRELGRLDEAEACFKKIIFLSPQDADAHSNLGNTQRELGKWKEAEASLTKAIALKPDDADAHNNLGITLQELGKLEDAEAHVTKATRLKPDFAKAHRNLTTMKTFYSQDEQYSKMRELYLNQSLNEEERCNINFGLAKACEDLEDFKQAYLHYNEGNALRKKLLKYDINQDMKLFKALKSNYPQISKVFLKPDNLAQKLIPIFIVGMPRSGTTLVEQIISSHPAVMGAGELNFVKQFGADIATGASKINSSLLAEFRANYFEKIKHLAKGNVFITDKMPQNFRYIGLIATAFPEAKIIHVTRDPGAVCWANYKQFFANKGLGYSYSIEDVIHYFRLYQTLMEFWINSLTNRLHHLDYEQLTVNQENETKRLIAHIGLDWDEKFLHPQDNERSVASASNIQVRKKIYQGSSQQWKKYEPFLNGVFDQFLT